MLTSPQRLLRFSFPGIPGQSKNQLRIQERAFNDSFKCRTFTASEKLALMLKRQSRRVMADVTECPPDTLPAHLARLDDLSERMEHDLRHDLKETRESLPSGAQLLHPSTVADYLAALKITRAQHRAPAFVNSRDCELAALNRKLDTIAGLFSQQGCVECLTKGGAL